MTAVRPINLAQLCNALLAAFEPAQLRELCVQLRLDAASIGLWNDRLAKPAVIALVSHVSRENRIDELFRVCQRAGISFSSEQFGIRTAEWLTRPLPEQLVAAINAALDLPGKPYFTYTDPTQHNNWTPEPVETGCFAWRLATASGSEHIAEIPGVKTAFATVSRLILSETAYVYAGFDRHWTHEYGMGFYPCIIVAPTLDQFDLIRIEQTADGNADIEPVGLIDELQALHRRFGLRLVGATDSTVEFQLTGLTSAKKVSFVRWFKRYAPHAFDEQRSSLSARLSRGRSIRLWWD